MSYRPLSLFFTLFLHFTSKYRAL
uniref:Uncharacterized protein n=1 Tax=Anguilla anguilla TaxID=7936 RepID=A0A0E9SZD0_ANGAN